MTDLSILKPYLAEDPQDFSELGVSCGKFIDTWLAAGGEPTDDAVVGFYSIWSQSLDVPGGEGKAAEEADFYASAYPQFIRYRDEVCSLLGRASNQPDPSRVES